MVIGDQLDLEKGKALLDAWFECGLQELDTAFLYPSDASKGLCEEMMGKMHVDLSRVSTKANPWTAGGLKKENVLAQLRGSLERLGGIKQVDIFYLHGPDHSVKIEETLEAVQQLFEEGCFRRFGLSNFAAWQVMEIHWWMKSKGWVVPTVAQYLYNVLSRDLERELIPCLSRLGISLYIFNATCGGFVGTPGFVKRKEKNEKEVENIIQKKNVISRRALQH